MSLQPEVGADETVVRAKAGDMRALATASASWATIQAAVVAAAGVAQVAIVARVVTAKDFGLMAIALLVTTFGLTVGGLGLGQATVRREELSRDHFSALYWVTLLAGCLFAGLVFAAAPAAALLFQVPELTGVVQVTALGIAVSGAVSQFEAIAQRNLQFRTLAIANGFGALAALSAAALLALALDYGVWALVGAYLTGIVSRAIVLTAYAARMGWMPSWRWGSEGLTSDLKFGAYVVADALLGFVVARVDQVIVGLSLGATQLGIYSVASAIAVQPMQRVSPVLGRVAYAVLSRVQADRERLARGYGEVVALTVAFVGPVMLGLVAVAPALVPVLLGDGWSDAVVVVQILAASVLFRIVGAVGGAALMARGKSAWSFWWNVGAVVVFVIALLVAAQVGTIVTVSGAVACVSAVGAILHYVLLVRRVVGHVSRTVWGHVRAGAGASVAMMLLVGATALSLGVYVPVHATLAVSALAGMGTYLLIVWRLDKSLFDMAHRFVRDGVMGLRRGAG